MGFFKSKPAADVAAIIQSCDSLPAVSAAREVSGRINTLSDGIARLDAAIGQAETDLANLSAPELPRATVQRAELAARVRLNEADNAELERFDVEQAKALRAAEAALARISADREALQHTLGVLRTRRSDADGELTELKRQAADSTAAALRAIGQAVAASYLEVIRQAAPTVAALRFLSDRAARFGGHPFAVTTLGAIAGDSWPAFDFGSADSTADSLRALARMAEPFADSEQHEKMRGDLAAALAALGLAGV